MGGRTKSSPCSIEAGVTEPHSSSQVRPARAYIALHVAALLFGCTGVLGAAIALPPAVTTLGRATIAAATLALVARFAGVALAAQRVFVANGALLALHWFTFFAAVESGGVAIAVLGFASFPLFALPLETWLLGRRWRLADTASAGLVTAGLVVLGGATLDAQALQIGLAYGLVSGCTFAWLAVRNRAHASATVPLAQAFWQNLFAAVWLLPAVAFGAMQAGTVPVPTTEQWGLLAVLGVFCTALSHTLFITGLRHLTAHAASIIVALEPVYGIALAAWLLGQVPSARVLLGGALIVIAVVAASRHVESGPPAV
jgi:drug/metabolite transporter (DMT)-like permease